jgi:hypothetical protein
VLLGFVLFALTLVSSRYISRYCQTMITEQRCVGQPLDRLDEIAVAEKHFEIDGTATALVADATVENSFSQVDGEAIVTSATDRTGTDEFTARLAQLRTVCLRDLNHVAGARLLD